MIPAKWCMSMGSLVIAVDLEPTGTYIDGTQVWAKVYIGIQSVWPDKNRQISLKVA